MTKYKAWLVDYGFFYAKFDEAYGHTVTPFASLQEIVDRLTDLVETMGTSIPDMHDIKRCLWGRSCNDHGVDLLHTKSDVTIRVVRGAINVYLVYDYGNDPKPDAVIPLPPRKNTEGAVKPISTKPP